MRTPPSSPLLTIEIQHKNFGQRAILGPLQLSIAQGEVVTLLGPSGCGKSTLLRMVAGLDPAYAGTIRIRGSAPAVHRADVGFIFQEPRLLPWLTVAENIGFDRGRAGARDPRTTALLAEIGLSDYAQAYPKHLSGGMAQRVAIARGLFNQPDLLLIDEPFSALDAFTRRRLQDLLLRLAERHQTTLLVVTHDIDEAAYLSDRVVVMGTQPGGIRGVLDNALARPRQRHDPALAHVENRILALLDAHLMTADDPALDAAAAPVRPRSVAWSSVQFAV